MQRTKTEQWDLEIKPKAHLFDLNLKEVWRYRDLIYLFVKRDFTAQYKQTVLGPLWHFIQPVFTTVMFLFIFHTIAGIKTDDIPAPLFYMSGITIWNYFSACFSSTSNTFVANSGIFGKVYFPRLVLPLSIVVSNLVRFGIQFLLLFAVMLWYAVVKDYPIHFGASWLLIPFLLIMMAGIGLGLGIIISSLTTKYRDFIVLIGFGLQLLMYATPVVYPLSFFNNKSYKWIIDINPLTSILEGFRYGLFQKGSISIPSLVYSFIFMIVSVFIGLLLFSKVERTFMDTV